MKPETVHSLVTARTLYEKAKELIASGDRHMCTAGLVILQDSVEIMLMAMLVDKDIDQTKNLDRKSFDELLGELSKLVPIPRYQALKNMNKMRVLTKHHGQLAEPAMVQSYLNAADEMIGEVLPKCIGKSLRDILLTELLQMGMARDFLLNAAQLIDKGRAKDALIEIRKAIFVEIEIEYTIHRNYKWNPSLPIVHSGTKAPKHALTQEYVETNVNCPTDLVYVDFDQIRIDAAAWGVNVNVLFELFSLTPIVYQFKDGQPWHVTDLNAYPTSDVLEADARYCLDLAVSAILKKQQYEIVERTIDTLDISLPNEHFLGCEILAKAYQQSLVLGHVEAHSTVEVAGITTGFNAHERYLMVSAMIDDGANVRWAEGFLLVRSEEDLAIVGLT